MSATSWNPPTGPPNGAPVRSADARREIEHAIDEARARDGDLRAQVVALTTVRVQASAKLAATADEADEAKSLASRALVRANDAARAGQRADAARWTGAAQVFALRVRDARQRSASLQQQIAAASEQVKHVYTALGENVGRLEAVVSARLPALSGRRAGRVQLLVDGVVAAISAPTADLVARATEAASAAVGEDAGDGAGGVVAVADDDLEREVDFDSADALLDELRGELGLPPPTAAPPAPPTGAEGTTETAGTRTADRGAAGKGAAGEGAAGAPSAEGTPGAAGGAGAENTPGAGDPPRKGDAPRKGGSPRRGDAPGTEVGATARR